MDDQFLPGELCKICNDAAPKYRCPRCSTQTCSLPCYKRHQMLAQCSGKPNPAAYLKQDQLATAAGIDHDFNFLSRIDRELKKARNYAKEHGLNQCHPGYAANPPPGSRMAERLKESNMIIRRAPWGMSRHKQNKTKWMKDRHMILWTIEWILQDQSKVLHESPESSNLGVAFSRMMETQKPSEQASEIQSSDRARVMIQELEENKAPITNPNGTARESNQAAPSNPTSAKSSKRKRKHSFDDIVVDEDNLPYFYLHKPETRGPIKVLIPVASSDSLFEVLSNRKIVEFPTIYALYSSPEELPQGFELEADYDKRAAKVEVGSDETLAVKREEPDQVAVRREESHEVAVKREESDEVVVKQDESDQEAMNFNVDSKALLASLQKDITGR